MDYRPVYAYSRARSLGFTAEFFLLNSLSFFLPHAKDEQPRQRDLRVLHAIRADLQKLLKEDSLRIERGIYPLSVLKPESPLSHFGRYPRLLTDALSIHFRRLRGKTTEFSAEARELLPELPRYYRRNFHFQTNGYLSSDSAEVYDHQVELLFKGSADAMRRLIIEPMRKHFGKTDGEGLRFLEIGAGTGRATRFVHLAFPKAKIVAVDLSDPYLKVAQRRLSDLSRIDFVQADGADLPYKDGEFDAVYSVFLFHELPAEARREVLAESARVLKKGGFIGFVDSIQTSDKKLFDPILREFPQHYHEPFYRDYIARPMEAEMKKAGVQGLSSETGFTSKVCWGKISRTVRSSRAGRRPRSAS